MWEGAAEDFFCYTSRVHLEPHAFISHTSSCILLTLLYSQASGLRHALEPATPGGHCDTDMETVGIMASQAPQPGNHVAGEPLDDDNDDRSASIHVENPQYHEVSESFAVPTKTGDEEAVRETQYDDERPVTAGSVQSAPSDYNDASDGFVLAGLMASQVRPDEIDEPPAKQATVFVRPSIETEAESPLMFTFGKASRPQLDMVGTRKGPLATTKTPAAKTTELVAATNNSHPGMILAKQPHAQRY